MQQKTITYEQHTDVYEKPFFSGFVASIKIGSCENNVLLWSVGQFPHILCIHTYTCMYKHTYTYIYMHTYIYICMYVCEYTMYVCIPICISTPKYINIWLYISVCVRMNICMYAYIHLCIHLCIY